MGGPARLVRLANSMTRRRQATRAPTAQRIRIPRLPASKAQIANACLVTLAPTVACARNAPRARTRTLSAASHVSTCALQIPTRLLVQTKLQTANVTQGTKATMVKSARHAKRASSRPLQGPTIALLVRQTHFRKWEVARSLIARVIVATRGRSSTSRVVKFVKRARRELSKSQLARVTANSVQRANSPTSWVRFHPMFVRCAPKVPPRLHPAMMRQTVSATLDSQGLMEDRA